jgi:hypothetical protein
MSSSSASACGSPAAEPKPPHPGRRPCRPPAPHPASHLTSHPPHISRTRALRTAPGTAPMAYWTAYNRPNETSGRLSQRLTLEATGLSHPGA